MKKLITLITTISLYASLTVAAYANKINGQFICELKFMDGSGGTYVIFTEGNKLKRKRLGDDDLFYSHYKLIHIGQTNEFKTFVHINNTIVEDILTITYDSASSTKGYHLSITATDSGSEPKGRLSYGTCKKV